MEETQSVSNTPETASSNSVKEQQDAVSYDTHKKLLSQRKSDQEKMRNLESQLNEFVNAQKNADEQKLQEQGEYKKLVEQRNAELESLKNENLEYRSSIDKAVKLSAFREHLGGTVDNDSYYNFVNTDDIIIDPETGIVDPASVDGVVNNFKQSHPKLYTPRTSKSLPNEAPKPVTPITTRPTDKDSIANTLREELAKTF